jgi:hypothetical protein
MALDLQWLRPVQIGYERGEWEVEAPERLATCREDVVCEADGPPALALFVDSSAQMEPGTSDFLLLESALIHASQSGDQLRSDSCMPRRRPPVARVRKAPVTVRTDGKARLNLARARTKIPLKYQGLPMCRCPSGDLSRFCRLASCTCSRSRCSG